MAASIARWCQWGARLSVVGLGTFVFACQAPTEVACTRELRPGVGVIVLDDRTGSAPARAQAAVVTVQEGEYRDTLSFAGFENAAPLRGAIFIHDVERAGTYRVRVELRGYERWEQSGVEVLDGRCHVHPAMVTAELESSTS